METFTSVCERWRKLEGVAIAGVVRCHVRLLPKAGDEICVLYSGIYWNVKPKKVKVLYAKYIHAIILTILEYYGARETL
jgi:hypothetical protein